MAPPMPAVLTARQTQVLDALGIGRWRRRALDDLTGSAQPPLSDPSSAAEPDSLPSSVWQSTSAVVVGRDTAPGVLSPALPPVAAAPAVPLSPPTGAGKTSIDIPADWDGLRQMVAGCQQCRLCTGRQRTVFGSGASAAPLMIIGEGPGADEDAQGEPFVGRAGKLLDEMLSAIGASREHNVFITNVVKCRPPSNRDPDADEVAACRGYLNRQIELVQPRLIVALGRVAAQCLLESRAPLSRLRGSLHCYGSAATPLWVTYHPAYLLREPREKRKSWADLQRVHRLLSEVGAG